MDNYLSKPIDLDRLNTVLYEYFPAKASKNGKKQGVDKEALEKYDADDVKTLTVESSQQYGTEETKEQNTDMIAKHEAEVSDIPKEEDVIDIEQPLEEAAADILLYHSLGMISNLYEKMLNNLGYTVEKAGSEDALMDQVVQKKYKYVLFDGRPFVRVGCLISDTIKDSGAIPIVIRAPHHKMDFCCEEIIEGIHVSEVKQKLQQQHQ